MDVGDQVLPCWECQQTLRDRVGPDPNKSRPIRWRFHSISQVIIHMPGFKANDRFQGNKDK